MTLVARTCFVATVLLLGSCTQEFSYRVSGTVIDAETGQPLEGVRVDISYWNPFPKLPHDWSAPKARPKFPLKTDEHGRFHVVLSQEPRIVARGLAQWNLDFEKKGYIAEAMQISPDPKQLPRSEPSRLRLIVYLRRGSDSPNNRRRRVPPLPAPGI